MRSRGPVLRGSTRSSRTSAMRVKTRSHWHANQSRHAWWPTSSALRAATGCWLWTCIPARSRAFATFPLDHLTALAVLADYVRSKDWDNLVVVAPDPGRGKMAQKYAAHLDSGVGFRQMMRRADVRNVSEATADRGGHTRRLHGSIGGRDLPR